MRDYYAAVDWSLAMSKLAERIHNEALDRFYELEDVTGSTRNERALRCLANTLDDFWPHTLTPNEISELEKRVLFYANV